MRKYRRMFDILDEDRNGYIEKSEVSYVFEKVHGEAPTDDELLGLMKADIDGDGKITFHEFTKFLSEFRESLEFDLEQLCNQFSLKKHEKNLRQHLLMVCPELCAAFHAHDNAELFEPRRLTAVPTVTYKGYALQKFNAMHIAVDMCKHGEAGPVKVLVERLLKEVEEEGGAANFVNRPFTYTGKGEKTCEAQAIHLAAATGQKGALLLLVNAGANVNARAEYDGIKHATPLHDAAWFQHADVVIDLLERSAAVDLEDSKGMTALHLVVQQGKDEQTVKEMIGGFLGSRADLGQTVSEKDKYNKEFWGKTAFTIAADRGLSKDFPMEALHLLAPNFARVAMVARGAPLQSLEGTLFDDVSVAAECGFEPGVALARALSDETYTETALKQAIGFEPKVALPRAPLDETYTETALKQAIKAPAPGVLHMLARLTVKSPELGATLLEALTVTPEVEDAKSHGLLTLVNLSGFMGLSANPMRCAYETDINDETGRPQWKAKQKTEASAPAWQKECFGSTTDCHTDNSYAVKIQVIHLPNVLDKEMIQALSLTPSWCLEIFAKKSVQAVVIAGWDQVKCTYGADLLFNILILPLLLVLGARNHFEAWKPFVWWLLLIASVHDAASLCLVLFAFRRTKKNLKGEDGLQITWLRWLVSSFNWVVDAMACLALIVFVFENTIEQDSRTKEYDIHWRVWLSVTFLLRYVKVMYMLRGWFTGFNAFFSAFAAVEVINILTFVVLNFFMFWGAFVVLTEKPSDMLDSCVKALLFSEWNGVEVLRTAHGEDSVFSLTLAFLCSVLFTFCFNSLVTAVFSDKYNDDCRRSGLIFLNERARLTLRYMYWRQGTCDVKNWWRRQREREWGCAGFRAWPSRVGMLPSWLLSWEFAWIVIGPGAMVLTGGEWVWTGGAWARTAGAIAVAAGCSIATTLVVLTRDGPLEAAEGGRRFVWLCYREDFDPDVFKYGPSSDDSWKIEKIKQGQDKVRFKEEMEELQKDTDSLKNKVEQLGDKLVDVDHKVDEVLGILKSMHRGVPTTSDA